MPEKQQFGQVHQAQVHLQQLDSLFQIGHRQLWIYGAGFMGQELASDLKQYLGIAPQGYIDQNTTLHLTGDPLILTLDHYTEQTRGLNQLPLILLASRHWREISQDLHKAGFKEPDTFLRIGYYCESTSPLELEWFYSENYYDAYLPIREQGDLANRVGRLSEAALYDYFSSRQGEFTMQEGLYLEQAVGAAGAHSVLELGPGRGKSTLFLAKGLIANAGELLVSVDLFGWEHTDIGEKLLQTYGYDFYPEFIENISFDPAYQQLIEARQMDVMLYLQVEKRQFDLTFIDLFHTYDEIIAVFQHLGKLLKPGADVLFHDYSTGWPGEVKAIDELLNQGVLTLLSKVLPGSLIHCKYKMNI